MTPAEAGIALVRAFGKGARFEVTPYGVGAYVSSDGCEGRSRGGRLSVAHIAAIAAALTACHAEGLAAIEGEGVAAIDGGRVR